MSDSQPALANRAVFLSYASQDVEAAGVEGWFNQGELGGGDAWNAKIRGQVASCALFGPKILREHQPQTLVSI